MDGGALTHSDQNPNDSGQEKLSIYSGSTPDILLVDVPSPLEQKIGSGRRKIIEVYDEAHSRVQNVVSKWIGVEHAIESRVKSIISVNEHLTPGILYVGVATLTGSIIARNRRLPIRLLLPPTFFFLSLDHFLPITTHNLKAYLSHLEHKHFPKFAERHDIANAHSSMAWSMVKEKTTEGKKMAQGGARGVVDKVQEVTGLKIREVFRLDKVDKDTAFGMVETKVTDAVQTVEEKAGAVKVALEKKLENGKNKAQKKIDGHASSPERE